MSRSRRRVWAVPVSVPLLVVGAVAIMHVLMVCGGAGHADDDAATMSPAPMSPAPMTSALMTAAPVLAPVMVPTHTGEHLGAAMTDCAMHDHGCVFTRGGVVVLVAALGLLAVLAPPRRSLVSRLRHCLVVLGRPPPWAVHSHIDLRVIVR